MPYTGGMLASQDGIPCAVLDVARLDFSQGQVGRKSAVFAVFCARGGEEIRTQNATGKTEDVCVARPGDAIFQNPQCPTDRYVPCEDDGMRWRFDEVAQKGYEILAREGDGPGACLQVRSLKTFSVLHEVVRQPSCIRDAWGAGHHQFLYPGASLKRHQDGTVTGIDKAAFDATWEILTL